VHPWGEGFLKKMGVKIAVKISQNGRFHHKQCIFGQKNPNFENVFQAEFFNHLYHNLAKFQLSRTFLS